MNRKITLPLLAGLFVLNAAASFSPANAQAQAAPTCDVRESRMVSRLEGKQGEIIARFDKTVAKLTSKKNRALAQIDLKIAQTQSRAAQCRAKAGQ